MKYQRIKSTMIFLFAFLTIFVLKYNVHAEETNQYVDSKIENTNQVTNLNENTNSDNTINTSKNSNNQISETIQKDDNDNVSNNKEITNTNNNISQTKTKNSNTKSVSVSKTITKPKSVTVTSTNKTMYVKAHGLNVRKTPNTAHKPIGCLSYKKKVNVTGKVKNSHWVRINYGSSKGYVSGNYLTNTKPTTSSNNQSSSNSYHWNGTKLNRRNGVVYGPSGKETYYNLPMGGVVRNMRRRGYNYKYWVRSDGVKMYGNYVMVAANLSLRPYGTKVPTTLGRGMVCDTGSFARRNPRQLDIAVAW